MPFGQRNNIKQIYTQDQFMRTSTLRASKASSSLWKLFAAILLVWLLIPVGQVSAQNSGTLKAYWKFSRPDGTHGQLNLFCAASGAEGNEITDWAKPGWQHTGAFHQKDIETVVIEESFKNALPTSCKEWFDGCSYLTKIEGIENLNTEEVTDMSGMFYECAMLKSIDHSKFNTTKVKTMKNMFYGFGSYVDVSNPFNTVRPTLDLSHFNTSSVLDMEGMFANCSLIKKLDVSCFNTSNVTSMRAMFGGCAYLSELNLKGFSTTATTDMANMFDQCYSLTQLDLSSFTITDKLKDTEHMFKDCMSLSSIYANDWSDLLVSIKTDNMFDGCNELVGAVAFEASKLNGDMANGQTGYFMPRYTDGNDKVTYFEKNENNQIVLNLYNANPFVVTTAYNIDKGTYTRQNMPSNWGTVCVPFIIDVTNAETNCEIYKFHAVEGENLYIEKVAKGEIAAGTPVIVKGKGADLKVCSPERNQAIVTAPVNGTEANHLEGTFAGQKLEGTSNYFIAKDKFWQVSGYDNEGNTIKGVNVPPFRATITAKGSQAQSLGIVVIDETNGIDLTPTVNDLLSDKAEYFDLQGRRLDGPQKGINLVRMGGKTRKVVIK